MATPGLNFLKLVDATLDVLGNYSMRRLFVCLILRLDRVFYYLKTELSFSAVMY